MYFIKTDKDINECFDIIERTIIESTLFTIGALGYVGKVDRRFREFWIVDHMNLHKKGNRLKYYAYRRFEATAYKTFEGTSVEGEFKLIPLYKITFSIYMAFLSLIAVFVIIMSNNFIVTLKVLSIVMIFIALGMLILNFNINRSKKYESEVVNFIDGLLNKESNIENKKTV